MKATDTAPGKRKQKAKMNLPNRLTVLRLIMVPVFIAVMVLPDSVVPALMTGIIGAFLFITAAVTDMLDGKIARKYGLITDFGKLMDPLADKFMVIGALTVIVYRYDTLRPVFIYEIPFLHDFLPGWWTAHVPLTYITCAAMTLFTVLSGVNYFRAMWKYLDPGK